MKQKYFVIIGLLFVLFLAGCNAEEQAGQLQVVSTGNEPSGEAALSEPTQLDTIVDEQGAVSVAVTPLGLSEDAPTLDFEVLMDTHSVELDMNLATLATLMTDNGRTVTATLWDAVPGGHHLSGVLSFPGTEDGTAVLEGATQLTLTIREVDTAERIFVWSLTN
jgi:hypothetical protein